MKLTINNKEYNIKFGYKACVKSKILSRLAKIGQATEGADNAESLSAIEDMMAFVPDLLLVGLQKNHSDEFGYDLDTSNGYDDMRDKVFDLMSTYIDDEDGDCVELFQNLQDELLQNGFLKQMFSQEVQKAQKSK
jgi:hypothetical protein|nr:MAG TPA: tail assembly chaperone protein [Caudoviricetes sp.]